MIDRELLTRKIALISEDLEELRTINNGGLERYLSGKYLELAAERLLERTINRMIDINYHVMRARGLPPPKDYYDSFVKLVETGLLEAGFASKLATSAGLRNRIVHEYDSLDPKKVFAAIGDALADIPVYLKAVNSLD